MVERSQGTTKRWAGPKPCRRVSELQSRLEADDVRRREVDPHLKGRSRWEVYPGLSHSGRRYWAEHDRDRFQLALVLRHLSTDCLQRRTDAGGKGSIWNRNQIVRPRFPHQPVFVHLEPLELQWVFTDASANQLRLKEAKELTVESICSLKVTGNK